MTPRTIFLAMGLAAGLAAASLAFGPVANAEPPADWFEASNAVGEFVDEPVFGGRVALYRAGPPNGDPVVLVHGLGREAARDWSRVIPALAQRYAVYALDLPGFGYSDKGNHLYSPENFARVLDAVLAGRVKRPVVLVGHSMGASVALAYAAAYPKRVSRLVLVDAAGVLHRSVYAEFLGRVGAQRALGIESPWFESVVRAIQLRAENWPIRGDLALERPGVRRRLLRGDPNAIAAFALVEQDFTETLRAIKVPTLVIWGAEDTIAPPRTGQALASAIAGARLVVLEAVGHAPQVQVPNRFNPILLDEIDGRQLAAPTYAFPDGPIQGNRTARCDGQRGAEFTGDYERLVFDNCVDALIRNARIGTLELSHSIVRVVNSHIHGGVAAKNSRLELTGGSVRDTISLDATSLDAAAIRFGAPRAIASNTGAITVSLRFSVSELSGSGYAPRGVHDIMQLAPGETLIR